MAEAMAGPHRGVRAGTDRARDRRRGAARAGQLLALAVSSHPYAATFSTGTKCAPREVATDAAGNVYVACAEKGANNLYGSIRKFDSSGTPVSFTANQPYINGNEIDEDPAANTTGFERLPEFGQQIKLAVDRSNSLRSGYIYADTGNATGNVDIFDPTGKYVTSLKSSPGMQPTGVGVDEHGFVYVFWEGLYTHIGKYNPETYLEVERINDTNGEEEELAGEVLHRALLHPDPPRLDRGGMDGMGYRILRRRIRGAAHRQVGGRPVDDQTASRIRHQPGVQDRFRVALHGRKIRNRKLPRKMPPAAPPDRRKDLQTALLDRRPHVRSRPDHQ